MWPNIVFSLFIYIYILCSMTLPTKWNRMFTSLPILVLLELIHEDWFFTCNMYLHLTSNVISMQISIYNWKKRRKKQGKKRSFSCCEIFWSQLTKSPRSIFADRNAQLCPCRRSGNNAAVLTKEFIVTPRTFWQLRKEEIQARYKIKKKRAWNLFRVQKETFK